jgi:hypothetical protein
MCKGNVLKEKSRRGVHLKDRDASSVFWDSSEEPAPVDLDAFGREAGKIIARAAAAKLNERGRA